MNTVKQTLVFQATRNWLQSEPGDAAATLRFKLDLVYAGLYPDTSIILGFICGKENDTTVQVITPAHVITIDTVGETMNVHEMPPGFTARGIDKRGDVVF